MKTKFKNKLLATVCCIISTLSLFMSCDTFNPTELKTVYSVTLKNIPELHGNMYATVIVRNNNEKYIINCGQVNADSEITKEIEFLESMKEMDVLLSRSSVLDVREIFYCSWADINYEDKKLVFDSWIPYTPYREYGVILPTVDSDKICDFEFDKEFELNIKPKDYVIFKIPENKTSGLVTDHVSENILIATSNSISDFETRYHKEYSLEEGLLELYPMNYFIMIQNTSEKDTEKLKLAFKNKTVEIENGIIPVLNNEYTKELIPDEAFLFKLEKGKWLDVYFTCKDNLRIHEYNTNYGYDYLASGSDNKIFKVGSQEDKWIEILNRNDSKVSLTFKVVDVTPNESDAVEFDYGNTIEVDNNIGGAFYKVPANKKVLIKGHANFYVSENFDDLLDLSNVSDQHKYKEIISAPKDKDLFVFVEDNLLFTVYDFSDYLEKNAIDLELGTIEAGVNLGDYCFFISTNAYDKNNRRLIQYNLITGEVEEIQELKNEKNLIKAVDPNYIAFTDGTKLYTYEPMGKIYSFELYSKIDYLDSYKGNVLAVVGSRLQGYTRELEIQFKTVDEIKNNRVYPMENLNAILYQTSYSLNVIYPDNVSDRGDSIKINSTSITRWWDHDDIHYLFKAQENSFVDKNDELYIIYLEDGDIKVRTDSSFYAKWRPGTIPEFLKYGIVVEKHMNDKDWYLNLYSNEINYSASTPTVSNEKLKFFFASQDRKKVIVVSENLKYEELLDDDHKMNHVRLYEKQDFQ